MCIDPRQTGFAGKGSDHLQLIKFWPSRAPGKGSAVGQNFWLHLTTASAQCLRLLRVLFHCMLLLITSNKTVQCYGTFVNVVCCVLFIRLLTSLAKLVIQRRSLAFRHIPLLCCWHMVNVQNLLLKNVSSCLMTLVRMIDNSVKCAVFR